MKDDASEHAKALNAAAGDGAGHDRSFEVVAAGHRIMMHPGGPERLAALIGLIENARESLSLVSYIYAPDDCGRKVRDALVAAARRGVAVTIILDAFGSEAGEEFFAPLTAAGGVHLSFSAAASRRYLIRNHQKIVLADRAEAMLGGFNIAEGYFTASGTGGWADLGFMIDGPVVAQLDNWFKIIRDWSSRPDAQLRAIRREVKSWDAGKPPVQLLIGGPTRSSASWPACLQRDLDRAHRLDMVMAYFSPPPKFVRRIGAVARRGIARLVMAGKSDNSTTIAASRAFYGRLLKNGVEVFEFAPDMLHTKLIVLDDAVYLGSGNLDMRSLYLNLEIMLRIEDSAFASRMRRFIDLQADLSQAVTPAVYRSWKGPLAKLRWWASWFLVAVVDYTVTRRLNLGI